MKTAVEWLEEKLNKYNNLLMIKEWQIIIEQAKQMEKEQIIISHLNAQRYDDDSAIREAEQYYNETYKNTNE